MTYRLELAEDFNARVPVGTPVRYWPVRGWGHFFDTVTRSAAWALGDGEPVVEVEGVAGGVSIEYVRVLPAQCHARGLEEAAGYADEDGLVSLAHDLRARAETVRRGEG
ncbi:MAG: hypothetical protein GWN84_13205 [Gammaproteobacteria bacterium]|nr:hypothetical protein [Gammaproteobacteria bacterium]NIR83787.1 hypothetical protein [Gammaproteobacteria bacterium]NIU05113.1 hypothetical protein [Gammaproteobacteria bacterium]NIV51950.1 hypothetical protein [Gammaproteobacteria bacterium]NIX86386.1 hypothetical protein [Gammaproteobacteria bacterium]